MDSFNYIKGQLYCENVNVDELASKIGTPFYLYSQSTLEDHYTRFSAAFAQLNPLICYSVKNCSNINILKLLINKGTGIDIVSGGELFRALEAGADPSKIVFAGVGKTSEEIEQALYANVGWINIESEEELKNIARIASLKEKTVNVTIRINPNVYDPKTHQKTTTGIQDSKFGIDMLQAKRLYQEYLGHDYVKLTGVHIHIGSPIYSAEPYIKAINKVLNYISELKEVGVNINMIDIGGGYLSHYKGDEETRTWEEYSSKIVPLLSDFASKGGLVVLEPGRSIAANAAILVSKVLYRKQGVHKKFIIADTGMSHIIRPAFYDAYHFIWPTKISDKYQITEDRTIPNHLEEKLERYDIVGPICESSDFLAKDRLFPRVEQNDLIAVFTTGSYCMTMASQYNSIPRPAEVLVHNSEVKIIRKKETYEDLIALEREIEDVL